MDEKSEAFFKIKDLLPLLIEEIKRELVRFSKNGQVRNSSTLRGRIIDLFFRYELSVLVVFLDDLLAAPGGIRRLG